MLQSPSTSSAMLSPAARKETEPFAFPRAVGETGLGIIEPSPAMATRLCVDRRLSNKEVGLAAELKRASSMMDTGRAFDERLDESATWVPLFPFSEDVEPERALPLV